MLSMLDRHPKLWDLSLGTNKFSQDKRTAFPTKRLEVGEASDVVAYTAEGSKSFRTSTRAGMQGILSRYLTKPKAGPAMTQRHERGCSKRSL